MLKFQELSLNVRLASLSDQACLCDVINGFPLINTVNCCAVIMDPVYSCITFNDRHNELIFVSL